MKSWLKIITAVLCAGACATANASTPTSYDESLELGLSFASASNVTFFRGFKAVSTTDPLLVALQIGNPALFLEVGKRYRVVNSNAPANSFSLIGDGSGLDDVVLLAQGSTVGTAESLPSVNWHDGGGIVYFTFSEELLALMSASGREPRYASTPTGSGHIFARGTVLSGFSWTGDSAPQTESFEGAALQDYLFSARNDWFVSSSSPTALYTARIQNLPANAPGQAAGSTKWLRIVDGYQPSDDTLNSVVSAAVVAPQGTQGTQYTWEFLLNVEAKASTTVAYIGTEHFNQSTGSYTRAWGVAITGNEVFMTLNSAIVSSGALGGPLSAPLYQYSQPGFGTNQWVRVVLTASLATSSFTATVYPSNGGSPVTGTISLPAQAFASGIAEGNFRFAVDNSAPVNNSTLCIDNLSLQTSTQGLLSVDRWEIYQ